jgi:hypothetical protein
MKLAPRLRKLAVELDAIGTDVDDALKEAERMQIASEAPVKDEQQIQKLSGLSKVLWDAHTKLRRRIPGIDRLDAQEDPAS